MQINDLNKIIGRALSACRKASGRARYHIQCALRLLNRARSMLRNGDTYGARFRVGLALEHVRLARELVAQ